MIRALALAATIALAAPAQAQQAIVCQTVVVMAVPAFGDAYGAALARQMIEEMTHNKDGGGGNFPAGFFDATTGAYAIAGSGQVLFLITTKDRLCRLYGVNRESYDKARRVVMGVQM